MVRQGFARIAVVLGAILGLWGASEPATANWTANVGYQNPAGSTLGLNFLYFGQSWAFEWGIGWIDLKSKDNEDDDESDKTTLEVAGDIDLKYLFGGRSLRPYLQAGFGYGAGAAFGDSSRAGVATGSGFGGIGVITADPGFYGYASYNLTRSGSFIQAGLGVDI